MPISEFEAVMKAAGDPTRARILKLLEQGELCVCEVMEILSLGQSTVSEHLSQLKKAGLVSSRRQGRWAYYSLSDYKANQYAPPMLALMMGWLDDDARVRADRRKLTAMKAERGGECT